jgi:hypothetical protein
MRLDFHASSSNLKHAQNAEGYRSGGGPRGPRRARGCCWRRRPCAPRPLRPSSRRQRPAQARPCLRQGRPQGCLQHRCELPRRFRDPPALLAIVVTTAAQPLILRFVRAATRAPTALLAPAFHTFEIPCKHMQAPMA